MFRFFGSAVDLVTVLVGEGALVWTSTYSTAFLPYSLSEDLNEPEEGERAERVSVECLSSFSFMFGKGSSVLSDFWLKCFVSNNL